MSAPSWAPSLAEIGGILHARTIETGTGEILGTFTADTIPTDVQVTGLIEDACADVLAEAGAVPAACEAQAKTVAKYGTAMVIELSFFPNQVGDDPNIYDALEKQYESRLARLIKAIADSVVVDDESGAPDPFPEGGFPGLVGTTLTEDY